MCVERMQWVLMHAWWFILGGGGSCLTFFLLFSPQLLLSIASGRPAGGASLPVPALVPIPRRARLQESLSQPPGSGSQLAEGVWRGTHHCPLPVSPLTCIYSTYMQYTCFWWPILIWALLCLDFALQRIWNMKLKSITNSTHPHELHSSLTRNSS